jgi:nitroreductase
MGIVDAADEETLPCIQDVKAGQCIACGQCEAFCPTGSLVQGHETSEKQAGAWTGGQLLPDNLGTYLKSRRSIRQYRPEPVARETIETLLDIARYAATGGNRQPVEWLVIHDPREVRKVAGLTIDWMEELARSNHPMSSYAPHLITAYKNGTDVICRGAPHLLIPHIPEDNQIAPVDAVIALTHVDIAAPAYGIGTCWAGFVAMASQTYKPLLEYYSLPEGRKPAYAMMFGYPRYMPRYIPSRNPLRVTWK